MWYRFLFLVASCVFGLTANTVKVELIAPENHPKNQIPFSLIFEIPEHNHIYGPDDQDSPTMLCWHLPKGVLIEQLQWPSTQRMNLLGHEFNGYKGKIYVCGTMAIAGEASHQLINDIKVDVNYLVCGKLCTPEKTSQIIQFVASKTWESVPKPQVRTLNFFSLNMLLMFLFALAGGILLNLMPCVLPILALKVMNIARHTHAKNLKTSAMFFTLGTVVSFWILDGLLLAFRMAGHQVGWGFQLQSPMVVTALIFVFYGFALNLFGVFEVGLSLTKLGHKTSSTSSPVSSFFHGVLACIVATPCSAPFMGAAVGFALTQGPIHGFVIFTGLALGLSGPYLLVCFSPKTTKFLPKPGAWMNTFKNILGFGMAASVVWLLHVLSDQVELEIFLNVLLAILIISIAAWVYGSFCTIHRPIYVRVLAALIAAGLSVGAYVYATTPIELKQNDKWLTYSVDLVEDLRKTSPVLIDFTAKWCITCQINKRLVLNTKKAQKLLDANNVKLVRADWTNYDPIITKGLEQYGRSSVPLYVLLRPDGTHKVLPEILSFNILKEALEELW